MAELASEFSRRNIPDPQEPETPINRTPQAIREHLQRMKLELENVMGHTRADRLDWLLGKPRLPKQ